MIFKRKTFNEERQILKSHHVEYVTLVEVLELTRPFEEFATVAQAAARRLEIEGVQALVTSQFYALPGSTEVGAILTFSDRRQMIAHIKLIAGWEEFPRFFRSVRPLDVPAYGRLSPEAEEWIQQFIVFSKTFEHHVAGFVRDKL